MARRPVNRGLSGCQHEQDNAQRPNIAPLIVRFDKHLWRYVVSCAHYLSPGLAGLNLIFGVFLPFEAKPEIDEHEVEALL
jgi:hypothetical protein